MNEKIIEVLEKIVNEPEKIEEIKVYQTEYFFRFAGQVISLLKRDETDSSLGEYSLYFYPRWRSSLGQLISTQEHDPDSIQMAPYHSIQFPSPVQKASFKKLYSLLTEKALGIDEILDEILGS